MASQEGILTVVEHSPLFYLLLDWIAKQVSFILTRLKNNCIFQNILSTLLVLSILMFDYTLSSVMIFIG